MSPTVLGLVVIVSLGISKYYQKPAIFLLMVLLTSLLYQRGRNRRQQRTDNFVEALINISKFIVVTGILGYVALRITGFFLPGFD
jgi:1,4-dihydroxy-2-naphthoate octaprenyltransferase